MKLNRTEVLERFAKMIRLRTVSHADGRGTDAAAFAAFRSLFRSCYPVFFERGEGWGIGAYGTLLRIPGRSSEHPSVLMAHYDVVDADPSSWSHDPFGAERADGRIWGRGTLDTKSTLLAVCEAMAWQLAGGFVPANDIYLAFGGEEEVSGPTAAMIVSFLKKRGVKPDFVLDEGGAVIPEGLPGVPHQAAMIGSAEKGTANYLISCEEHRGGHTSAPPRHTVAGRLAAAAGAGESHEFPARLGTPVRMMFEALAPYVPAAERPFFRHPALVSPAISAAAPLLGGSFRPMVRTTCAVTIMDVRAAFNVLPESGALGVNARLIEGDTVESVRKELQRVIRDPEIRVETISGSDPSPVSDPEAAVYGVLADTIRSVWKHTIVAPYQLNGGTDARFYADLTDHVYRFSPMIMTKEERAAVHGIDESVSAETLFRMIRFYIRLIGRL